MQGNQKTPDSFRGEGTTESGDNRSEAISTSPTQSMGTVTYADLIEMVVDDGNIDRALKRVVGNRGAPGVNGMSVHELEPWFVQNREAFKEEIRAGAYILLPSAGRRFPRTTEG